MKVRTLSVVLLIIVSVLTFSALFTGSITGNDTTDDTQNVTYVTAINDTLLGEYENSTRVFSKRTSGNHTVYKHQRLIGDAVVAFDGTTYIFDEEDNLIYKVDHWMEGLNETPPSVISKEDAELIVGEGKAVLLRYIDPELDAVFAPVQPTPTNPCWIVCVYDSSAHITDIVVVDAVTGEILGHGELPPSGYVLTGPKNATRCEDTWSVYAPNAYDWFNTMGYDTQEIALFPEEDEVRDAIQDLDVAVFFEAGHSLETDSLLFGSGCDSNTSSYEVADWLENYPKMPFTFLLSCDSQCHSGMINATTPSLSYAFRKGSSIGTATVGFCGLGSNWSAWVQVAEWQDTFFQMASNGHTVKESFNIADNTYEDCGECSRFAGDPNLKLVPKIYRRDVKNAVGGEVRDVNGDLLSNVYVSLYEHGGGFYGSDVASPSYNIEVTETGDYWLLGTKTGFFDIDTSAMFVIPPLHIDLTTPELLAAGYVFDFEGDYGLVPRACGMSYALESVNHWLFVPADASEVEHPEWRISSWKAMDSVHSWQYPS
jgi:hypothetical protein